MKPSKPSKKAVKSNSGSVPTRNEVYSAPSSETPEAPPVVVAPVVSDVPAPSTTNNAGVKMITLNRSTKPRKGSSIVFTSSELRGTVKFPASAFITGMVPDTLVIEGSGFSPAAGTPKAKLTKEERAALKASITPAQRVANEEKRLAKAQERLAKLKAAAAAAAPAI